MRIIGAIISEPPKYVEQVAAFSTNPTVKANRRM